jgi:hypothetical protein
MSGETNSGGRGAIDDHSASPNYALRVGGSGLNILFRVAFDCLSRFARFQRGHTRHGQSYAAAAWVVTCFGQTRRDQIWALTHI